MKRFLLWHRYKMGLRYWALRNWMAGYARSPVRRCRDCGHTAPYHMLGCPKRRPVRW